MLMIDPKRVELSNFNGVPHLLRPVVTEMKQEKEPTRKGPRELTAIEVLKWLLWEMERRALAVQQGNVEVSASRFVLVQGSPRSDHLYRHPS